MLHLLHGRVIKALTLADSQVDHLVLNVLVHLDVSILQCLVLCQRLYLQVVAGDELFLFILRSQQASCLPQFLLFGILSDIFRIGRAFSICLLFAFLFILFWGRLPVVKERGVLFVKFASEYGCDLCLVWILGL